MLPAGPVIVTSVPHATPRIATKILVGGHIV